MNLMPFYTKNKTERFKSTQRFRVIVNGISFYTDARALRTGVGDFTKMNESVCKAVESLEKLRTQDSAVGLTYSLNGYNIQLSMI